MKKRFCDICARETTRSERHHETHFKVKTTNTDDPKWKKFDICPVCKDGIKEYLRQNRNKVQEVE